MILAQVFARLKQTALAVAAAMIGLVVLTAPAHATDYTTSYTWDANRRLIFTIGADPGTGVRPATKNIYDADGQLREIDKGTTTSTTGANFTALEATLITYDAAGNKAADTVLNGTAANTISTPALSLTQYAYDADDRPTCTAIRMAPAASLPGSACTQTNPGGPNPDLIKRLDYFADGTVQDEMRGVGTSLQVAYATFTYTPNGKVQTEADADGPGHTTTTSYDGFDRVATLQYPDATTEQTTYDPNDNILAFTNRVGLQIKATFDALNQKITEIGWDPVNNVAVASESPNSIGSTTFDYDLKGRPIAVVNGQTLTWAYDTAGRLRDHSQQNGDFTTTYDAAGNPSTITHPGSSAQEVYTYDSLNRIAQATISAARTTSGPAMVNIQYDALGRRQAVTFGDTSTQTYVYDNDDRVTSIAQTFPNSPTSPPSNVTYNYQNDPAGRLTQQAVSNSLFADSLATPSAAYTGINNLNQYGAINGVAQTYYRDGALQQGSSSATYAYDEKRQMVLVANPTDATQFQRDSIDPTGRRWKSIQQASGSIAAVVTYGYDGARPEVRQDATVLTNPDGSTGSSLLRDYLLGAVPDERLAFIDSNGATYYPHTERQGSLTALTTGGQDVQSRTYGPYGAPNQAVVPVTPGEAAGGASAYPYLYTGQAYEANFGGRYFYKARTYDPINGRFLQPDPIGMKDDLNLYSYTHNDPLDHQDATGLAPLDDFGIGPYAVSRAEIDFGNTYHNQTVITGREPGSTIYSRPDGHVTYSVPNFGPKKDENGAHVTPSKEPAGAKPIEGIHAHPTSDTPSAADEWSALQNKYPEVIVGATGKIVKIVPHNVPVPGAPHPHGMPQGYVDPPVTVGHVPTSPAAVRGACQRDAGSAACH